MTSAPFVDPELPVLEAPVTWLPSSDLPVMMARADRLGIAADADFRAEAVRGPLLFCLSSFGRPLNGSSLASHHQEAESRYRQALRMELGRLNAEYRRLLKEPIRSAITTRRSGELRELRVALCVELFDTREPVPVVLDGRVPVNGHAERAM